MSIINKKVIVCDLDGTLAESKSSLSPEMADVLCGVLKNHFLIVVSGGKYAQFQKQFLSSFSCSKDLFKNLLLFPTNGSTCYVYDMNAGDWKQLYDEPLPEEDRQKIIMAFNELIAEFGLGAIGTYGTLIEDRGSQITFSGLGQDAPVDIKRNWDPNQEKRREFVKILSNKIPNFEIRLGGMTSIDVTRKGIDKAYAVTKIRELLSVSDEDIVFIGDALYQGGNDSSVKKTGIDFIQKDGPGEVMELLKQYI